jgi:very-short-patch-repair endonuclease
LCKTVHRFQGDEKDIIIFSPVLSNNAPDSANNFIKSTANLFNVAITRARAELIVIGDKQKLYSSNIPHIVHFVEYVNALENKAGIKNEICKPISEYQSDWEIILCEALTNAGIDIIPQYSIDKYVLDIAIIKNNRKLNIEIDGEMYHKDWTGELLRKDQMRNCRLQELGWDIKRFWVYQIRDMLSSCIADIESWYNAC